MQGQFESSSEQSLHHSLRCRHLLIGAESCQLLEPGWGKLARALQKLPPGAVLCGNTGGESVFITSELGVAALEKFYVPLFASLGCKLTCKQDDFTKADRCDCPKAGSGSLQHDTGYVHLQRFDQAYQLFFASQK